jgi:hypothetical protein
MNFANLKSLLRRPPHDAIVVIPVYAARLTSSERAAVAQCRRVLANHPICILAPQSLVWEDIPELHGLLVERFADDYFTGVEGYNRLLLSTGFWDRFLSYRYILIHQLDAWVFSDQLDHWTKRGYDYVGAPWIGRKYDASDERVRRVLPFWSRGPFVKLRRRPAVGNGGFSLRNVRSCLAMLHLFAGKARAFPLHEDIFFCVTVPAYNPLFRIPGARTAARFAFELEPRLCYEMTGHTLPFGCHAWEKYDPEFWRPFIEASLPSV